VLKKISNFQSNEIELIEDPEWKIVLSNLRRISKALANYYEKHLRNKFNSDYANLLLIAQNKNLSDIFKFGVQVFGACVQAPNKSDFIGLILQLTQTEQQHLMNIIRSHGFVPNIGQL
jgi:hypothetical protein